MLHAPPQQPTANSQQTARPRGKWQLHVVATVARSGDGDAGDCEVRKAASLEEFILFYIGSMGNITMWQMNELGLIAYYQLLITIFS